MSTLAIPRVQIIDPDIEFRETLASYLRNCGYWVETCGNLDGGLEQAAHANFDLILVENALPETVGLTVLPTLQACQSNPCILLMSQDPGTALVRTALKEGAFDFLIKPLELAQIEKSMAAGLENRKRFSKFIISHAICKKRISNCRKPISNSASKSACSRP